MPRKKRKSWNMQPRSITISKIHEQERKVKLTARETNQGLKEDKEETSSHVLKDMRICLENGPIIVS